MRNENYRFKNKKKFRLIKKQKTTISYKKIQKGLSFNEIVAQYLQKLIVFGYFSKGKSNVESSHEVVKIAKMTT